MQAKLSINDLKNSSLGQVSDMYRSGMISDELCEEYIELWNRGPHFTKAQLADGVIRNYLSEAEPDEGEVWNDETIQRDERPQGARWNLGQEAE